MKKTYFIVGGVIVVAAACVVGIVLANKGQPAVMNPGGAIVTTSTSTAGAQIHSIASATAPGNNIDATQYSGTPIATLVAAGDADNNTTVEVQGKVTNRFAVTQTSTGAVEYFIEISDGTNNAFVMLQTNTLAQYGNGDIIDVKGVVGYLGSCGQAGVAAFCAAAGVSTQKSVPMLVPLEPGSLSVVSSSSGSDSITSLSF